MTRSVIGVLALAVLLCALSSPAAAQSNNPCLSTQTWWAANGPAKIGWFFFSSYPGTYAIVIAAWNAICHPADSPSETCPCANESASNPISLATGDTYIIQNDIQLPGLSGGLRLVRTWNSLWPATQSALQIGLYGPNWRSSFEERIFVGGDQYIKYGRADGSFWSFGVNGGNWSVAAPANNTATLVQGSTNWTLTFQNGEQRLFSIATGKLVSIIDRNGNTTQLSYDSLGRLATVTDPVSRHLYFSYGSGSSYLVTSVTSDVGLTLSYSYDSQGRLSQVTRPDLSTWTFQYDSNSFITAVTDSNGKILESHTYDSSGRGLTGSRAGGVEAVTISYQ
jgi:YD repeat-containing protein